MNKLYDVTPGSTVVEVLTDGKLDLEKNVEYIYGLEKSPTGRWAPKMPKDWGDAARRCVYKILSHSFKSWDRVSDLRDYIDYMIDEMGPESTKQIANNIAAEYWTLFGSIGAAAGEKTDAFPNFLEDESQVEELTNHIVSILVRKQRDYGHSNIARFGRAGLLVRCHDKVARLENLLTSGRVPENESVVDNFTDVIGYAAIGIMWENGWFLLELPAAKTEEK